MEIVNNHELGKQSQIISLAIGMDVPDLPDWIFELTPNRAKLYMQFRLDCAEYVEIFDDQLFHQLFTDDTIDDEWLEDILACFDGGYNVYKDIMFNVPIGPAHTKELRRIIENRIAGYISYEDATELINMFDEVQSGESENEDEVSFDETDVLKKIQAKRLKYLNKKK